MHSIIAVLIIFMLVLLLLLAFVLLSGTPLYKCIFGSREDEKKETSRKRSAMLEILFNHRTFEEFTQAMKKIAVLNRVEDKDFDTYHKIDLRRAFELFTPDEVGKIVGSLVNGSVIDAGRVISHLPAITDESLSKFLIGAGERYPKVEERLRQELDQTKENKTRVAQDWIIEEGMETILTIRR